MNLGQNETRRVEQQENIGRRRSIISDRRNTRAPVLETNANLRNARRGDVGGAQELLRTLGMLQGGLEDVANTQMAEFIDGEQDNIAQGAIDQAAGTVDEELMERSLGYRNAVTKGRTVTAFAQASREFSDELEELIESQESPILEDRQAEIAERLESFYQNFAADPETGELREFLNSPGAMRYLAEAIQTSRPTALSNAQARVEERFNREALSLYSSNIADQAVDTGTVDIAQARELLPNTVTDEEVAETTLVAVNNAVEALRAEGRFAEATTLLAQLRGAYDTPADAGEATAAPTGTIPPEAQQRLRLPVQGEITSPFGSRRHPITGVQGNHNGVDIAVPVGTEVPAAMGGEIIRVWNADAGGLSVKVKYDDGTVAGFAHLSEQPIREGRFNAGDIIAVTGNSGRSTGPHLHYTLTRDGQKIDPTTAELGPISAPEATPAQARLSDPNADPVTAIEQSGTLEPLPGLEGITFSAQQQARINEIYKASTDAMRAEWRVANQERYTQNATTLALGVYGVDGRTTTMGDIRAAYTNDEIDGDAVMTLMRLHEGRAERREARAERAESRAERAEKKRQERVARSSAEFIVGQLLSGELTTAEARSQGMAVAASSIDPEVGLTVLTTVNSAAGAMDSAIMNSEPVVAQMRAFDEKAENAQTHVRSLLPTLIRSRLSAAQDRYEEGLTRARGRYTSLVASGTDPEVAQLEAEAMLLNIEAEIVTEAARFSSQAN